VAVVHDFLDEDAKAVEDTPRPGLGLSWSALRDLRPFQGPPLEAHPTTWEALVAPDRATPHLVATLPPAALALLQERLPAGSDLHRLLLRAQDGAFTVALHAGSRDPHHLDSPLLPGRRWDDARQALPIHADLETWERWTWAPQRLAEALLHAWSLHFLGPGRFGRDATGRDLLAAWRTGPLLATHATTALVEHAVHEGDVGPLLDAVDAWHLQADPARLDLARLLGGLDVLQPGPDAATTRGRLRAWVRWRLAHLGEDGAELSARLAGADPVLLRAEGFRWAHPWLDEGRERWVPHRDLRPRRPADRRLDRDALAREWALRLDRARGPGPAPALGICGPAAAGKSSLAVAIAEQLDDAHLQVGFLAADDLLWPGEGFRYTQHAATRTIHLSGPAIYDDVRIAARLDHLRRTCDVVVAEGCTLGLDPDVAARLDHVLGVVLEDRERLTAKVARDLVGGRRAIDVPTDFAVKVFEESRDGVAPILARARQVWDRGTGAVWDR